MLMADPLVAQATDPYSIAIYGGRDNALGFPMTGLAFAYQADGQALPARVLARYSRVGTPIEPLDADTPVDPDWLPILAGLDTGERLTVTRVHPTTFVLD